MRRFAVVVAALAVIGASTCALADPAPAPTDPAKLELARELVTANGGEQQFNAQIRSMFGAIKTAMGPSLSQDDGKLIGAMYDDMEDEMTKLAPQLIDISVQVYARNFSDKELRDLLAFRLSDSGRSISRKMPAVTQQTVAAITPLMMTAMPAIMQKTLDRVCVEYNCSASQRKVIADAMSRAMQPPKS